VRKPGVKLLLGAGCAALLLSLGYKLSMKSEQFPKRLLGPAKSVHTLAEMQAHPICLWGMQVNDPEDADGVIGGDETGMRSWLGKPNVTRDMMLPEILLRVKGTNLWASGQYDRDHKLLDALCVFGPDGPSPPWEHIQTAGTPVTYVAVPSIEGRKNVEFVAKNRRRWQALMVGGFTPVQAEQAYDAELERNKKSLTWPATQIRKDPELLKLAVVFLQRVAQDVLPSAGGVVFTDVGGWLEDEDPRLFERLVEEATTSRIRFRPLSRCTGAEGLVVDSDTREQGIIVTLTSWKRDGEGYIVSGCWRSKTDHRQTVDHQVSHVNGTWLVKD